MKKRILRVFLPAATLLFVGCTTGPEAETVPVVRAKYAAQLKVDGRMSDPAWDTAPVYRLFPYRSHEKLPVKTAAAVGATRYWNEVSCRLLYDEKNLYIGFQVQNDDVRSLRQKNQELLHRFGDTMEAFLKPAGSNAFAELYAAPGGNKSSIIFPSRSFQGTALLEEQKVMEGFEVFSHVDGTLNDGRDTDRGWSTVMVISRMALSKALGSEFGEGKRWTILMGGYCYSRSQIQVSNFSYPKMPVLYFLLTEYYADLVLEP
ncbi:carbohydrate-binding family 9-like protein [uncultured Victivallis sp.]|uniref:carbohydrate-binding family 9-like protein n=1 Tax=uncultured Victivallis sp. TaxID=354118 RepID=UPI0025979B58|nr:carbohydrate-binding family 9-like protein [uncultured Victivallis sp.]